MRRTLLGILILLAILGLADAAYLTAHHYGGAPVTCSIAGTALGNCNSVLQSAYATIGPIPISLVGAIYYFVLLLSAAFFISTQKRGLLQVAGFVSGLGLLVSLFLLYVQFGVLDEFCLYCITSAAITTGIFLTSLLLLRTERNSVLSE